MEKENDSAHYTDVCRMNVDSLQRNAQGDYNAAGVILDSAGDFHATYGLFCTL